MPTVFSHTIAALAIGSTFPRSETRWKFWVLSAFCSTLPDLDVVSFALGISYDDMLGHRGLTHSFPFAIVVGFAVVQLLFREVTLFSGRWWLLVAYFFIVTISHALLDALTDGGLGVALFAPFSDERFFFPWRPIEVSPIGVDAFLSQWGLQVLLSEFRWIWIPSGMLVLLSIFSKRIAALRSRHPMV